MVYKFKKLFYKLGTLSFNNNCIILKINFIFLNFILVITVVKNYSKRVIQFYQIRVNQILKELLKA